ncbi:MAG: hypothetical protein JXA30_14345 [Deltaproteobacteria bacterium]|nr:hypothetical protein [Deltaproteobacteria bacterium]
MQTNVSARTIARTAVVLLLLAAITSVFELFARQAPGSRFALELLPGPISALRNTCTTLGVLFFATAWLLPSISRPREPRWTVRLALAGATLTVGSSIYGALNSMYGIQITDLRPDATPLFVVKHLGHALLGLCLLDLARRLFNPPPES